MAGSGGLVPQAIVLALGAGALGGPEALRLLLQFAGRSAAVDLAICVVAISLVTAPLLGNILLARFVREARRAGGGGPPATDLFARVTATVSVAAAFLVTACLLVVPGGAVRLPINFAVVKNPIVVTAVLATSTAAAVATGYLPCAVPLRPRFFRGAGSAGGRPAPATTVKVVAVFFLAAMSSLVASFFVASGGFDAAHAQLLVGVAIVTVAGSMLLVRCSSRARNTAGAAIVTLSCLLVGGRYRVSAATNLN